MKLLTTYLIGVIFGAGIALSGMGNPAKVLNFFDVAGSWDPSLILVMGGALSVTFVGYRLVLGRSGPIFAQGFALPSSRVIDLKLVGGSALFGVGWGMTGFCPGGAIPALGLGYSETVVFLAAMIAGIVVGRALRSRLAASVPARHRAVPVAADAP